MAGVQQNDTLAYAHVIAKLNRPAFLAHVIDIVQGEDDGLTYAAIKNRLIEHFVANNDSKIAKLMPMELGDRKPSQLLAEMTQLAISVKLHDTVLQSVFLQALPLSISQTLAIVKQPLMELGRTADEMMAHRTRASVSQVNVDSDLAEQINTLTAAI